MFTRIDHVMICVPDLERGIEQYKKIGFNIHPGGIHPGRGTHNAIAFNDEDYVELLGIRDAAEQETAARMPGSNAVGLADFIARGGGIRYVIVQSDDLASDVAAMRARGVEVSDAIAASRKTPEGRELHWKAAILGPANALPLFFIQHLTPLVERRVRGTHPNGAYAIDLAYIVTDNAEAAAATYAKVLGMSKPALRKGTVIMANMAVFDIGANGISVVQPYAAGPAAEALERRGPGPFQALYRTTGMEAAARWMQSQGMPPPERGVRNNGEQAMLVTPKDACGAYVGFVGPA
jgi:catechol 2,3-dioxygenase-like lactoylglutathione lyase family enzyme